MSSELEAAITDFKFITHGYVETVRDILAENPQDTPEIAIMALAQCHYDRVQAGGDDTLQDICAVLATLLYQEATRICTK